MFDPAQFQHTLDKISGKLEEIPRKASELELQSRQLANAWYIPLPVAEVIMWITDEFVKLADIVIQIMVEIMEGQYAPFELYSNSYDWETIRGILSGVAADINPADLGSTANWKGDAATAYTQAIGPQSSAAAQLASLADKMSSTLSTCAAGGFAFYLAALGLLVAFGAAQAAAAAADATGVGAPPGLLAAFADASGTVQALLAFFGAFSVFAGIQASNLNSLHGNAEDSTGFPHGRWPRAVNI